MSQIEQLELIILADDVTGAADSAARCVRAGLRATIDLTLAAEILDHRADQQVSTTFRETHAYMVTTNVLSLSTDTRFLASATAAEQVEAIVTQLIQSEHTHRPPSASRRWYKKIDSTLRGNIGAELAAMLPLVTPANQRPCAIIAPAFPAQQRTLIDGYLCYAQLPPRTHHLPTLLAQQCTLAITTIGLTTVRSGVEAVINALDTAQEQGAQLIVVDAESDDDLATLVRAVEGTVPYALLCGSAGLVGILAQRLISTPRGQQPQKDDDIIAEATAETIDKRYPMLAVVGSGSTMAHQQLAHLREHASATLIEIDPSSAIEPQKGQREESSQRGAMPQSAIVLHLPKPQEGVALEGAVARQYAAQLAAAAQSMIVQLQPPTVLIVGGDTAVHLLQMLGIRRLQVIRELLPGMPLTVGTTATGARYQIILKAGNHGDPQTLAELLQ